MSTTLESESTLTDRYQTTVPETVRRALKLGKRDKIHYSIRPDGAVVMSRVSQTEEEDPVIRQFLGFLIEDLAKQPVMCQHFSGHKAKQILAAFRSSLATNSYWPNEVVHGCKTPQCIQIYLAWPQPLFDSADDEPALFSGYEKSFLRRHYPNNYLCDSCSG